MEYHLEYFFSLSVCEYCKFTIFSPSQSNFGGTVMYTNTLTTARKDKLLPILIERDGFVCFYCKKPFVKGYPPQELNFDHLNRNATHNYPENLVLSCFECNQKRRNGNSDLDIIAEKKRKENIRNHNFESLSEREGERELNPHASTDTDELDEGQINEIINKLVKSTLDEYLPEKSTNTVSYSQMLRGITYLVIQQSKGRGSETAVRRSLDTHCSMFAPWEDYKEGKGNRVIRRRKKN